MRILPLGLVASGLLVVAACGENETPPPTKSAYVATEPEALPCVPNLDGKIEARELSPQLGIAATYLVSPAGRERTVDLVGAERDGKRSWNFGVDFADDQVARIAAQKLDGKWYAADFAGLKDAFVTPIDAGGLSEGVYTHDENAFSLHGVASASPDGPNKTLLKYDTPIALYRFPLEPGVSYATTGEVRNGTFRGLPYAGRDTYEVKVDAAGELTLPDFTVTQALRVRTKVTISPAAGQVTTQRQTSFLFECLGEVVRATSKLEEPNEDFNTATELRRLGLAP
ncbi:MAG: hypothetical protein KF764_01325 [Labilithrix sp.]|nr:hypothetical protein [Labilithrix sp.]